jgi:2-polyprenyl-6-methoxyphenol hydroxylase-like FAD-dependent oxidoreductase
MISGAGPAGLTLAIELARRGVNFRLVEMMEEPFRGSRGKGIQPRSQEVFEDLGILDRIVSVVGRSIPPVRQYAADGSFTEVQMAGGQEPTPAEPYRAAIVSPQFVTEPAMRERLAELGRQAEFGRELTGFEQDGEGVTARIAGADGEETVRARYLVGTDGGHSFVRRALDVGFPGEPLDVRFFVADTILEGLDSDVWHMFNAFGSEQWLVVAPLRGTDIFQLQGPIPLEGDVDLSAETLEKMVATRTGREDILIRSVRWASAYATSARLADHFQVDRVFLAGDASHTHSPTGAQGLNTSVQDAYNLGWKLAAVVGGAPEALLATYEEERLPIAAGVLGLSTKLLREETTRRGREVHQLDLDYWGSSLSLEKPERSDGVRAGARAPDAPVRAAAGQPTRLFNLFQGPHWTLLGYEAARRSAIAPRPGLRIHVVGDRGDIIDDGGHVRDAYGLSPGDWVLVRPDGYIGAIVSGAEVSALDPYLARVGVVVPSC